LLELQPISVHVTFERSVKGATGGGHGNDTVRPT
jgi:hypothetical protein